MQPSRHTSSQLNSSRSTDHVRSSFLQNFGKDWSFKIRKQQLLGNRANLRDFGHILQIYRSHSEVRETLDFKQICGTTIYLRDSCKSVVFSQICRNPALLYDSRISKGYLQIYGDRVNLQINIYLIRITHDIHDLHAIQNMENRRIQL